MQPGLGEMVLVRKLDYATGHIVLSWPGTLVELSALRAVVRAPFASLGGNAVSVDGVPFNRGDVFTEFYFLDRCYNVFHIAGPDGRPKGWYCNVTLPPTMDADGITFVDLALDLFAHPDGRYTVLDENEFAIAAAECYREEDSALARTAIDELVALARAGGLPTPADVA